MIKVNLTTDGKRTHWVPALLVNEKATTTLVVFLPESHKQKAMDQT